MSAAPGSKLEFLQEIMRTGSRIGPLLFETNRAKNEARLQDAYAGYEELAALLERQIEVSKQHNALCKRSPPAESLPNSRWQ